MRNIKLIIEYDGTRYAGWQRQKNAPTIQEVLENGISLLTGEEIEVIGSSRTDAGVHAKGFVCNFHTMSSIPEGKFRDAINSKLPDDIVIIESSEVPLNFHSRYSAIGKTYSYTILNRDMRAAIQRDYVYQYKGILDIDKMIEGSKHFLGTHDFSAFKNTGSSVKTTVRTIKELRILKEGDYIRIYVTGDGFLYNMVRIMVGTLIDAGIGKIDPGYIKTIIELQDRKRAGKSAPANGLYLEEVYYI